MTERPSPSESFGTKPILAESLSGYFHQAVSESADDCCVEMDDATKWYLVNLLARFARSEDFFDLDEGRLGIRPMALLYGDAMHADSERERCLILRRLGDVSLFITGLFEGTLARRAVKREYFVTMGCGAYSYLADKSGSADGQVFQDLSSRFVVFVDVLSNLSSRGRSFDHGDIMRLYRLWRETGNAQAERQLRALGITLDVTGSAH
ncbi:MAG: hypothetical protein ACPG4N_00405 [Gammaproteobacteria bacterium]